MAILKFGPGLRKLTNSTAVYKSEQSQLAMLLADAKDAYPKLKDEFELLLNHQQTALRLFLNNRDVTDEVDSCCALSDCDEILVFHPISGG